MNTVMRTVGGVVGGQIGAALLRAYTIRSTGVPAATGFELAFAIGAFVALFGAALALLVTGKWEPSATADGSGRHALSGRVRRRNIVIGFEYFANERLMPKPLELRIAASQAESVTEASYLR